MNSNLFPLASLARRRVAPFSPLSLSPELWLKANALALSDGAAVASWTDSSGNNNHATQGTSGTRPTFKTAIVNGLPVVRYAGSTKNLVLTTALADVRTAFLVFSPVLDNATNYLFLLGDSVNYDFHGNARIAGAPVFRTDFASPAVTGGSAWSNSVAVTPTAASTVWLAGFSLLVLKTTSGTHVSQIAFDRSGANWFLGDYAEILLFNTALSDANRVKVQNYLNAKYVLY